MKLVQLRCPACNGTIKLDKKNKRLGVCEYCNSKYLLIKEKGNNYSFGSYSPYPYDNISENPYDKPRSKNLEKNNSSKHIRKIIALSAGVMMGFSMLIYLMSSIMIANVGIGNPINTNGNRDYTKNSYGDVDSSTEVEKITVLSSDLFSKFVENVYGKSAATVTKADLAKIRYIRMSDKNGSVDIEYSFDSPYGEEEIKLDTVKLSGELDYDINDLRCFTGLERLWLETGFRTPESLIELTNLKGFFSSGTDLEDILDMIENKENIIELKINMDSIDGINEFTNLERLTVDNSWISDLTLISSLSNLKELDIEDCDSIKDFSMLSVMTGLEKLVINSDGLKDIGFIKKMSNLTSFRLKNTNVLQLDALSEMSNITYLALDHNSNVKDYSSVEAMTNLETLILQKSSDSADPDLSKLTKLKNLDISGFETTAFLGNMSELEELNMYNIMLDDIEAFSNLVNLKMLKMNYIYGPKPDMQFIADMTQLKTLDLSGMSFYQNDITAILNMSNLEELILDMMRLELDITALEPNNTLKKLSMNNVSIYLKPEDEKEMYYDNALLNENTSLISNYTGLEELYLEGNQLTSVDFVADLPSIRILDINDNYVTDLKSLSNLEHLELIECKDNPITNVNVLPEHITVVN